MAKRTKNGKGTAIRLKQVPGDLKDGIRKFRAKRELADSPIPSDEKAVYHLTRRGLQAEGIELQPA